MTNIPGIANAAVGLATDIQSRYLHKLLTMPVSLGSVIAGQLLADGARLFVQAGACCCWPLRSVRRSLAASPARC
jgi:ABC-type Na+ efflux pump permease subunit